MRPKKLAAGFAISSLLAVGGLATAGVANASTIAPSTHVTPARYWYPYGYYPTEAACNAVGISLVAASAYTGITDYFCAYNGGGPDPWTLGVYPE